jgi:signal transduction histidine kinase
MATDEPVVLIVDDEAAHLRAVQRALADLAPVRAAGSGPEALRLIEDGAVAMLISDQRMGGMSGVELLAQVRQRDTRMVLVLLTAFAEVATLQQAINGIGIYHYVEKPWSLAELRQVVVRGLERWALDRQREQLVEDLRRSCAAVRREAEYKTRLLALLAHELGTPVHIAVNAIGLLSEIPVDERARRWIEPLRRAGDWLARGVAQMQRASRIESDELRLRRAHVDLSAVAGDALRELRVAAQARRLEIVERCAPGGAWVWGDRRWLHEVVWNLLTNAVRFTPDGGRVVVATERVAGAGRLIVEDSGIGFSPAALEDAFVPFSTASGDPALHGSGWLGFGARGLGLGLALCKRIVDAHGGRIELDSVAGKGSRCRVTVPATPAGLAAG